MIIALLEEGEEKQAQDAFQTAYNKGTLLEQLGKKSEARRAYDTARQLGYRGDN